MIKWSKRGKSRSMQCVRYIANECQDWFTAWHWEDDVFATTAQLNDFPESGTPYTNALTPPAAPSIHSTQKPNPSGKSRRNTCSTRCERKKAFKETNRSNRQILLSSQFSPV